MRLRYEWSWDAAAPAQALWPLVSDTPRVNRAVGLPPWHFEDTPDPAGGTQRTGRARILGFDVRWDEHPFEWRLNEGFQVERTYSTGPVSRVVSAVRLEPRDGGGTRLVHVIEADARGPVGRLAASWQLGFLSRRAFDRVYRRLIAFAEAPRGQPFPEPPPQLEPGADERLARAREALAARHPPALAARLVEHVKGAPDRDLARLRPFALAKSWGADRLAVLRLCLHATELGLLALSWDVLCPHCRGAKGAERLAGLSAQAHCTSCNVDFEAEFSRTVEISFSPSAAVRRVDVTDYCVGGPGNSPHVVAQRRLAPGASDELRLALAPGAYRLRGPRFRGSMLVRVAEDGGTRAHFSTDEASAAVTVAPSFTLALANAHDTLEQLFVLERTAWLDDAATADVVTSLQDFRELFATDALAPGEQLRVARLAFLFTDLKNSTAMYEAIGDAAAYAIVREHFAVLERAVTAHDGSVVKTIGDAVMAVFADPLQAARAADEMFAGIAALPPPKGRDGERLHIKVGLHAGPCLAVTLNERLDYFGTTVNLAARVQGESAGGDLVLTRALAGEPEIEAMLASRASSLEPFRKPLKGISGEVDLVRVRFADAPVDAAPATA